MVIVVSLPLLLSMFSACVLVFVSALRVRLISYIGAPPGLESVIGPLAPFPAGVGFGGKPGSLTGPPPALLSDTVYHY